MTTTIIALAIAVGQFLTGNGVDVAEGSPAYAGVCARYDGPTKSIFACVPAETPDGAPLVDMWEDGSAVYGDGEWVFDPESATFEPR